MDPETPEFPENPATSGFMSKKRADMTIGDDFKLGVGLIVITAVTPFVVQGVTVGVKSVVNKFKNRKSKETAEDIEVPEAPTKAPKAK